MRRWYAANREKWNAYSKPYQKALRDRDKIDAFNAYGGPACACCGETLFEGLTIDHINGDGAEHRRQRKAKNLYVWLRRNNYPLGFQVLCGTCNMAKGTGDHCPHQDITGLHKT